MCVCVYVISPPPAHICANDDDDAPSSAAAAAGLTFVPDRRRRQRVSMRYIYIYFMCIHILHIYAPSECECSARARVFYARAQVFITYLHVAGARLACFAFTFAHLRRVLEKYNDEDKYYCAHLCVCVWRKAGSRKKKKKQIFGSCARRMVLVYLCGCWYCAVRELVWVYVW